MGEEKRLEMKIRFDGKEVEFSGSADEAIRFMWNFLTEQYPLYEERVLFS